MLFPNSRGFPQASAYLRNENFQPSHRPDWSFDLAKAAATSCGVTLKLSPVRLAFKKVTKRTLLKRADAEAAARRSKAAKKAWVKIRARREAEGAR
jgi:hypothetical protein